MATIGQWQWILWEYGNEEQYRMGFIANKKI
jgi:hypothetical protein